MSLEMVILIFIIVLCTTVSLIIVLQHVWPIVLVGFGAYLYIKRDKEKGLWRK